MTPRGVWIFCDSHDVRAPAQTVARLVACRASAAIAMVQGITPSGDQWIPDSFTAEFVRQCKAAGLVVVLCAFPDLRGNLAASAGRLRMLGQRLGCRTMLDAEPRPPAHWSPSLLRPWLDDPDLMITTTRIEAPYLGSHNRIVFAQLEQQTSTATLGKALAIFGRFSALEHVVPVTGSFDTRDDPRTLAEFQTDLDRCRPQAVLSGALATWNAHTIDGHEARALAAFQRATWPRA